jgi:hypothetical protein
MCATMPKLVLNFPNMFLQKINLKHTEILTQSSWTILQPILHGLRVNIDPKKDEILQKHLYC